MERRTTIQKELIYKIILNHKTHLTAEEIYSFAVKENPTIGKGTVYRNLGILTEEGKIKKIEVSDGADYYDYQTFRHYHIECIQCGKIYDVDMKDIDMNNYIKNKHNFEFLDYDILFKGICPNCKEDSKKRGLN